MTLDTLQNQEHKNVTRKYKKQILDTGLNSLKTASRKVFHKEA